MIDIGVDLLAAIDPHLRRSLTVVKMTHIADAIFQQPIAPVAKPPAPHPDAAAIQAQVAEILERWASAHQGADMSTKARFYAPIVTQYFGKRHVPRAAVANAGSTSGPLTRYSIGNVSYSAISETKATVHLEKIWSFNPGGVNPHHTQSELKLRHAQDEWLIVSERDLSDIIEAKADTPVPPSPPESPPPTVEENKEAVGEPPAAQVSASHEPIEISGVLVRIDPHAGKMYYRITSPIDRLPTNYLLVYTAAAEEKVPTSKVSRSNFLDSERDRLAILKLAFCTQGRSNSIFRAKHSVDYQQAKFSVTRFNLGSRDTPVYCSEKTT